MTYVRELVINTAEKYYSKSHLDVNSKAEEALSDFINNPQNLLLQGVLEKETHLQFHSKVQDDSKKSIIFYKTVADQLINPESVRNINIVTLSGSPAESLYQILRQIYSPLLSTGNDLFSNKLQKNLSELESNLRILAHGRKNGNLNVILSMEDEVDYWKAMGQRKETSKKEKEAASSFLELFEDICEEIRTMQSTPMSEVREAAENVGGMLDDVWRLTTVPYSQDRMIHTFDVIGHTICTTIQAALSTIDLWKVQNGPKDCETLNLLSDALKVIQTWTSACKALTETYWPNYALHAWSGKGYVPPFCLNFQNRVKEIYDIKSTHNQLNKLLTNNERLQLMTDQLFEPFENINVWICNGTNQAWDTAVSRFSANLRPAEAKIAEKLKPRLHNTSTKQMLYEFMRYKTLIDRPLVKYTLNNELEIFVSSLLAMLKSIQSQFDTDEVDVKMHQPPEMSPLVQQVQWAKQTEAKVKDIQMCAEKYLKDFEGSADLVKLSTQILKDLKTMYTQLHEEWSRDLQAQVKNGTLQLSLDKPVVEFSASTRMMVVNYNPRLVWAELEARSLSALGLPSPPAAAAIDTLAAALKHARALQQVASFHNTLGERMIPSTRPMMLQAALDLSSLVQDQKAVYWNDTEQLANYTDKLKKLVLKLESQNTYLTSQHVAIRKIVEKLMDIELLAKQSEWKKMIKDIRDIVEKVEANGYKNTESWRTHWDWQLYKAIECQYMKTLLSLHKHFPHVKVDLVLRGHKVRLQPPLEEIRVQHYHQLRRLVSMPALFVGLQPATDKPSIFNAIVEKHSWLGNKAVKQLEESMSSLEQTCESWTRRAALACVPDLEAICTENLHEPHDWEVNFKACKAYGQAVAKMSFEDEKIHWISVGTATLRREFEAQARNLWACLMSTLQASCRADAGSLDTFVANATVMLEEKAMPKNAKELAEISVKQQAIQGKMPEMEKLVEGLKRKGHLLRTWGGEVSVDGTIKEWLRIKELMISQQQMFEHQAEIVKSSLTGDWENLNTSVEAWLSRLSQARSRYEETHGASYADMIDRCRSVFAAQEQWEKYTAEKDELLKECEKFNMNIDKPDVWKEAETLMNEYVNLWGIMKEYNEDYESIAEQDWIIFQKKLHLLDEFVSKWSGRLEPYTTVTLFLQQELDKYTDLTTLMKYLRGTDFTERHWREVFSLLEMENKKSESLQVKDFLNVALNVKKQIKALQKISAVASSEAAIRTALNELELWFAGARLAITYYHDKTKKQIPIVKDFKDILAKIEEQQWVVSSVTSSGDACAAWESRLRAARTLVRAAHHAQRRWLYLEPILSNDEGELGTKFRKVDQGFRQVTRILESDPRLSALLQSSRLQPMLDSISEQLLACQSALNKYIDEKRSIFPRLYFLSDDDLLELLGQARAGAEGREAVMQTHLKKLFPGTTGVKLGPGGLSITALCSQYGETFQLDHPVDIDCPVELWLKNLETEMRSSLKSMTLKCVGTNSLQDQDPFSLPTQILCLAQNIRFTEQAEKAIASKELHKLRDNVEKENFYYASAEVEDESERQKRQALILQCAYYMAVIRILIDNNVVSATDWLWQKQLRFYLTSTKEVVAKMGLAQISYSYEYLGVNTGQFVRTELADECFLVLTQALHLGLVGNPFGPAGTGKTESVKALGGLVGRLVLIFNCDEAMDAECMGRLLTGLALCGAWGCFDEFNRLTADTLAAVSHQLTSLLAAMQHKGAGSATANTAILNGKQVSVSEWCGVCATMNPVGRGYGGRRELPAAASRVLRPVAMTEPRGDRLATQLLAARGIQHADALAMDLHMVFVMASTLLSGQRHYDWGLRALKATVGSCGSALDNDPRNAKNALRRALRLNSVSKLTQQDAERFENILSTVFANVAEEETATGTIYSALESSVGVLGLVNNKLQIQKCTELYEQMQQRMGVVIVGPPGSGKTTIRRLLKAALTQQGKSIVEYTICPKAMSRNCLLGHIDHDTRQWTDGVISSTALEISNQPLDVWSWVVCDGDIDPEWIEALNSVLDDNRLLTLPSGWRIQFGPNVNFIFETHSLEHASPATVSRMGIILLSDDSSCAPELLENWMQKAEYENETAKLAVPLLQTTIKKCLEWLAAHRSDIMLKLYNVSAVKQILTQFEYICQNIGLSLVHTTAEEIVYLALQRSITGLLKEKAVDGFQREMSELLGPPPTAPLTPGEWVTESVFMSARLAACEPVVRACVHSEDSHLLIVGPDACAKNLLAEYVLKESNSTVITIDCTPILEPADIIAELKRNNVVRSSGLNTRSNNTRVTILVRELHRARVDDWGSSPVHSFLLQLVSCGGVWCGGEEGGMQWCAVPPPRLLATAAAPPRDPRLLASLLLLPMQEPDNEELLELAKHYLSQSVGKSVSNNEVSTLSAACLAMFKEITETFDSRPHYKWNASHLRKLCENVKWYSPANPAELVTALTSEANMIFKDRLVTDEEKASFYAISKSHLKGHNIEGWYFNPKVRGDGVYLEAVEHRDWYQTTQKLINQCLTEHEYNVFGESGAEVCSELAILCPAIARATNGGIVVCVGSAGLGRRAAARVVSAALSASLFVITQPHQFNTQFKNALSSSAEGTRTLVLITESASTCATLAAIECHTHATTNEQLTAQMMDNIKQNLGIVICLDKDQENLSELFQKYPLLYNESHLVWLERWSVETLHQMPQLVIQRLIKENLSDLSKDEHESIPVDGFVGIYNSLDAEWMRAPCRYVNFVKSYYRIVSKKKAALMQRQNMLSAGVEALRRARSEVATLQSQAAKQEAALSDKQAKANQALDQIGATVRATTDKKEEMHALKKNIEVENEKLQIRKKEIEAELASVEPVIVAARTAVGDIKAESLSEVRSLRAPPDVVRDVLEGVLRLMGIADTSWHSMKNFLSKRGVKEDIRCLDASQISPEAVQSVKHLLERRGSSFDQATAKRASVACAPLAAWVRANLAYADALARVQPLQAQQKQLHRNLREAEAQLSALSSGLATVDERVAALKEQLGQHTRDAAAIELNLNNATKTIQAAKSLLDQLAHEYGAWETDLENISKEISELTLRSLLAAAYIVYLPDVTEPQAREYVNKWSAIIGFDDPSFSVINFLSTTEKQLKWDADGLPLDKSAIKNAILIDQILEPQKCGFTPLIIDPDGDAITWLKNTLADFQCDFVSQHSDKLQTAVQYAVRLGRVLVITEVDGVQDSWSPLLSGLPVNSSGSSSPHTAKLLLYSRDTTLPGRLPPTYAARLSLLHFTARLDGLTDQLVHYALQQQNPEVNEKSKEIKLKKATLQKQQHELQENLLKDLSTNSDILHDANLLASLNKTRATTTVISEALEAARSIERENSLACEAYEPSAARAAILALAVKSLATQRPLVALPVDTILDVFVDAVRREADQKNINSEAVVKYLTRRIIERVLLGLHKKDKYIVVLHLLKQVYDDRVPEKLWQLFIGGYDVTEDQGTANEIKRQFSWIPESCLKKLAQLKAASEDLFTKLSLNDEKLWTEFLDTGDINALYKLKLTGFETVAAVTALRTDSLYRAVVNFVDQMLGMGAMSSGDVIPRAAGWGGGGGGGRGPRPVLVLGAHAADVLAAHAHNHQLIQLGIEDGISSWEAAVESSRGGGWLALVVGASPFTQQLQAFLTNFSQRPAQDFSEGFRLWIVSEDREIPPLISNACVNVILEAPEGVKNNIIGTLSTWGHYEADPKLVRLHACLALFHALVQERRAYIPQGWSKWYSWEWGEVSACTSVIRSGSSIATARALSLVLYSARVGTEPDRKLLAALLTDCLGDQALAHSWKPRDLDLQLPFGKQLQSYISAFDAMPDIDSAQVLGLPANCRVAWEKNAINDVLTGLRELNCTVSVTQKADKSAPIKSLLSLWKKLMSGNPLLRADYAVEKVVSGWWGCVVAGEVREAGQAARALHSALPRTRLPLHKVPEEWQLLWVGPDAPDAYIKEFCFRARAAVTRLETYVPKDDYMPTELDLRSLVGPVRAVWALRVHTATRLAANINQLTLNVKWGATVREAESSGGLLVHGLSLCGCVCVEGALQAAPPRAPAHTPAPPLLLTYVLQSTESPLEPEGTLLVPVYSSSTRERVVFSARAQLARGFTQHAAQINAVALFVASLE